MYIFPKLPLLRYKTVPSQQGPFTILFISGRRDNLSWNIRPCLAWLDFMPLLRPMTVTVEMLDAYWLCDKLGSTQDLGMELIPLNLRTRWGRLIPETNQKVGLLAGVGGKGKQPILPMAIALWSQMTILMFNRSALKSWIQNLTLIIRPLCDSVLHV